MANSSIGRPLNIKVAIVGGSLAGLAAANVFHRLGARVRVFEKSSAPLDKRGACLGFVDRRLWERIRGAPMMRDGRRVPDQSADGQQSFENSGSFYYGDMWQFLFSGLPDGCVQFGATVATLGDAARPTVGGEEFDLAVVADGGFSTLRGAYFGAEGNQPTYSGYQIFWGRVDADELPGVEHCFDGRTESSGIYDAVLLPVPTFDGRRLYMAALFVATPEEEIRPPRWGDNRQVTQTTEQPAEQAAGQAAAQESTPGAADWQDWFLPFVRRLFGRDTHHVRLGDVPPTRRGEVARFFEAASSKGKVTPSPVYEYAASNTVAGRVVVIGDAAHMCSPMTALGAHTAMLDALGLWQAFEGQPAGVGAQGAQGGDAAAWVGRALSAYNLGGVERARALLRRSRQATRALLPGHGGKRAVPSPASLVSAAAPGAAEERRGGEESRGLWSSQAAAAAATARRRLLGMSGVKQLSPYALKLLGQSNAPGPKASPVATPQRKLSPYAQQLLGGGAAAPGPPPSPRQYSGYGDELAQRARAYIRRQCPDRPNQQAAAVAAGQQPQQPQPQQRRQRQRRQQQGWRTQEAPPPAPAPQQGSQRGDGQPKLKRPYRKDEGGESK